MYIWLFFLSIIFNRSLLSRSPHRPQDSKDPLLTVAWQHNAADKQYYSESHLQHALFGVFEEEYFFDHLLPDHTTLTYRYHPEQSINSDILSKKIEGAVQEIVHLKKRTKIKAFKDFNILKKRDVNTLNHTGLYVLEFKDYPFIVKLFVETPEGIVDPHAKGFEPIFFYYLAGLSRHFNGFTRIKNLENIRKIITADSYWADKVDFPRKWFWLPKEPKWIVLEGFNIGPHPYQKVRIPSIYAIICDKIIWEEPFVLTNAEHRDQALKLCNFLGQRIDSHINNFGREIQTKRIVPIDFEHFITAVGIEENLECTSYFNWFNTLIQRSTKRLFFRNKKERRIDQFRPFQTLV